MQQGATFDLPITIDSDSEDDVVQTIDSDNGGADDSDDEFEVLGSSKTTDVQDQGMIDYDDEVHDDSFSGDCVPLLSRQIPGYATAKVNIKLNSTYKIVPQGMEAPTSVHDEMFLLVKNIFQALDGKIFLRGYEVRRNSYGSSKGLPIDDNECHILKRTRGMGDLTLDKGMITLELPSKIIEQVATYSTRCKITTSARRSSLHCRWVLLQKIADPVKMNVVELAACLLANHGCPVSGKIPTHISQRWSRYKANSSQKARISFEEWVARFKVGDVFSGAGGSVRGAAMIGAKIFIVIEREPSCIETLNANDDLDITHIMEMDVHDFIKDALHGSTDWTVDLLHISPPCQAFSGLNRGGRNDDDNAAMSLVIADLLKIFKPRVVTVEQTAGLKRKHWDSWYQRTLRQFTDSNYQYRTRVIDMADHGLVQARRRIIVVATKSTEPLYEFPPVYHNGTRTTMQDCFNLLEGKTIPQHMRYFRKLPFREPEIDANQPLRCLVAASGPLPLHPNGRRSVSLQEVACYQGFVGHDFLHKFAGKKDEIKRMIGNAVPPNFQKIFLSHIMHQIYEFDMRKH